MGWFDKKVTDKDFRAYCDDQKAHLDKKDKEHDASILKLEEKIVGLEKRVTHIETQTSEEIAKAVKELEDKIEAKLEVINTTIADNFRTLDEKFPPLWKETRTLQAEDTVLGGRIRKIANALSGRIFDLASFKLERERDRINIIMEDDSVLYDDVHLTTQGLDGNTTMKDLSAEGAVDEIGERNEVGGAKLEADGGDGAEGEGGAKRKAAGGAGNDVVDLVSTDPTSASFKKNPITLNSLPKPLKPDINSDLMRASTINRNNKVKRIDWVIQDISHKRAIYDKAMPIYSPEFTVNLDGGWKVLKKAKLVFYPNGSTIVAKPGYCSLFLIHPLEDPNAETEKVELRALHAESGGYTVAGLSTYPNFTAGGPYYSNAKNLGLGLGGLGNNPTKSNLRGIGHYTLGLLGPQHMRTVQEVNRDREPLQYNEFLRGKHEHRNKQIIDANSFISPSWDEITSSPHNNTKMGISSPSHVVLGHEPARIPELGSYTNNLTTTGGAEYIDGDVDSKNNLWFRYNLFVGGYKAGAFDTIYKGVDNFCEIEGHIDTDTDTLTVGIEFLDDERTANAHNTNYLNSDMNYNRENSPEKRIFDAGAPASGVFDGLTAKRILVNHDSVQSPGLARSNRQGGENQTFTGTNHTMAGMKHDSKYLNDVLASTTEFVSKEANLFFNFERMQDRMQGIASDEVGVERPKTIADEFAAASEAAQHGDGEVADEGDGEVDGKADGGGGEEREAGEEEEVGDELDIPEAEEEEEEE